MILAVSEFQEAYPEDLSVSNPNLPRREKDQDPLILLNDKRTQRKKERDPHRPGRDYRSTGFSSVPSESSPQKPRQFADA